MADLLKQFQETEWLMDINHLDYSELAAIEYQGFKIEDTASAFNAARAVLDKQKDAEFLVGLYMERGQNIESILKKTSDAGKATLNKFITNYNLKKKAEGSKDLTLARVAALFPGKCAFYCDAKLKNLVVSQASMNEDGFILPKCMQNTAFSSLIPKAGTYDGIEVKKEHVELLKLGYSAYQLKFTSVVKKLAVFSDTTKADYGTKCSEITKFVEISSNSEYPTGVNRTRVLKNLASLVEVSGGTIKVSNELLKAGIWFKKCSGAPMSDEKKNELTAATFISRSGEQNTVRVIASSTTQNTGLSLLDRFKAAKSLKDLSGDDQKEFIRLAVEADGVVAVDDELKKIKREFAKHAFEEVGYEKMLTTIMISNID